MGRLVDAGLDFSILALIALCFSGPAAWGQNAAATGEAPIGPRLQAELLKTIDASRAKVGDEVNARTVMPLEFNGAKFPTGATVIGHVTEADPSRLMLLFDHIVVKKCSSWAGPVASGRGDGAFATTFHRGPSISPGSGPWSSAW